MTPERLAHFRADIARATELSEVDWRGNIVERAKQTKLCVEFPLWCATDDRTISIGVTIYAEVPSTRVRETDPKARVQAVAYAAATNAIPRLARYAPWNLYDANRCDIPGGDESLAALEAYELKQDQLLSAEVFNQLSDAMVYHGEVAAAFEKAKLYLEQNVDYLRHDPSRAANAARFIADCMRSDATPNMGMWNREKSSRLVSDVDDLIKRKNPAHPGYQRAAQSIRSLLYSLHVPSSWAKYPPPPTLLNI